jgi:hypothetical protein
VAVTDHEPGAADATEPESVVEATPVDEPVDNGDNGDVGDNAVDSDGATAH